MKEVNISHDIQFTPAAHAVLGGIRFQRPPGSQPLSQYSPGDLVELDGCSACFVVKSRHWKLAPNGEQLIVLLDLLPVEPAVRSVK